MRNIGFPGVSLCLVEANVSRPTQTLEHRRPRGTGKWRSHSGEAELTVAFRLPESRNPSRAPELLKSTQVQDLWVSV
jgi:hypothetical protein